MILLQNCKSKSQVVEIFDFGHIDEFKSQNLRQNFICQVDKLKFSEKLMVTDSKWEEYREQFL